MKRFVIRSKEDQLFWNYLTGWSSLDHATVFTENDILRRGDDPSMPGEEWVEVSLQLLED